MEVVGVAGDAQQALEDWRRTRAEVVLVDLGLPGEDGIAVGKRILEEGPETKVLIVSALNDAKVVGDALRAGFSGYLTKDTPLSHLLTQMEAVVRGEIVVQARLAAGATEKRSEEQRHAAFLAELLSTRELEVLALLAEGAGSGQMAKRLGISPNTVRTHVQSILMKLQVHSRLEAATFASKYGLTRARQGTNR